MCIRDRREGWLEAAYAVLIREGVDAVKILPLAEQLRLSRTSFYWHFENREALLLALAEMWASRTTRPLIAATEGSAETETEAMLNVIRCFLRPETFDAKMEFAMRGWGLKDAAILAQVAEADHARLKALGAMLERWGHSPHDADVRARTIYLVPVSYTHLDVYKRQRQYRMAALPAAPPPLPRPRRAGTAARGLHERHVGFSCPESWHIQVNKALRTPRPTSPKPAARHRKSRRGCCAPRPHRRCGKAGIQRGRP